MRLNSKLRTFAAAFLFANFSIFIVVSFENCSHMSSATAPSRSSSSSCWTSFNGNIINICAGNVGIGTTSPGAVLDLQDIGRKSHNDNSPTLNIAVTEGLGSPTYVTHYGLILNAHETSSGSGDRIGASFTQTCDATLAGKSCIGDAPMAVAGGSGLGGYFGSNPRALIPAGLAGPAFIATGQEIDIETHSPVHMRNGLRIADENQSGGTITHGSVEDAAVVIVTDTTAGGPGFKTGIQFGEASQLYPQFWPILPGGTLIQSNANNPDITLAYGIDLTGPLAGFTGSAIALPLSPTSHNGIAWGKSAQGGSISSTATTVGGNLTFTDSGLYYQNNVGSSIISASNTTGNVGIGTLNPQATLDINGTVRLAVNGSPPVACAAASDGSVARTSRYTLCICKGSSLVWVSVNDGQTACVW